MSAEIVPPASELLLTAGWVLPICAPPLRRGAVGVRGERITRLLPAAGIPRSTGAAAARIDLGDDVALLPGLVNVHTHLELTLLRGRCEEAEFFPWLRRLVDLKYSRLDAAAFRLAALWGAVEAIRAGITTVGDASDSGQVLEALLASGLRGIAYQEVFGPDPREYERSLAGLEAALERQGPRATDRVRLGVSPHAPYTVSAPLFRRVAELAARRGLPLSVHVAESRAEGELLRSGTGPFADHLHGRGIAWEAPGASPVAYLEGLGVLGPKTLLVHALDIAPPDVEAIRRAGAAVAHCPRSNAKLGHGVAPLCELLAAGVRVGLGTDGVVSNNGCDLIEEARFALLAQRARAAVGAEDRARLDARAALRWMTLGGAGALGMAAETGSIEPGKLADLAAIDLSAAPHRPLYSPETAIVFGAGARDVVFTMVGGRVLYERGRVTTLDEAGLRREVEAAAARLG